MRLNHDYDRGGAVAYLAAYDVHHATVSGHCEGTTGIEPFGRLVAQVMTQNPTVRPSGCSGSSTTAPPTAGRPPSTDSPANTPTRPWRIPRLHASWLNQIEIYFSIVERNVLSPNDFTALDAVIDRLTSFQPRYNQTARPFEWKFTTTDLNDLLAKLDTHDPEHNPIQTT